MTTLSFHSDAADELEEAAPFYGSRVQGLGKSFLDEVQRTADAIVIIALAHQRRRPGYWRGRK